MVPPLLLLPSPLEEEDVMVGLALASVTPDPPAGLSVGVLPLMPLAGCGPGGCCCCCCCGVAATMEKRKKVVRTSRDRVRSDLVGL